MEYKIRGQEEEPKKFVEFWLHQNTPNSPIELRVKRSDWGEFDYHYILKINMNGGITLPRFVSADFGFELDDDGRIIVDKEA